jgi:hypothetical protein
MSGFFGPVTVPYIALWILLSLNWSLILLNARLGRMRKGKLATRAPQVYAGVASFSLICILANVFTPNSGKPYPFLVGEVALLVLVLDDFLNGGPRKKRFRKWLKNKFASLAPRPARANPGAA